MHRALSLALVVFSLVVVIAAASLVRVLPAEGEASVASAAVADPSSAPGPSASASSWPTFTPDDEEEPSCAVPDRGDGNYGPWQTLPLGRMRVPEPPPQDFYDLLVHFHGSGAAMKMVAPEGLGLVVAGVDLGVGSQVYAEAFHGPEPLEELLGVVSATLAPRRLRHLIVSSWSAGYGAVRELLREHPTVLTALVLLDSVHTSYGPDGETLAPAGLEPFVLFARRAIAGEAVMVLTHSEIRPPGYASTSEVAQYLLGEVGGRRRYGGLLPFHGVETKTTFQDGGLQIRGYTGTGKEAHCAHVRMLADILKADVLPALSAK
jgi:hypothetical protein